MSTLINLKQARHSSLGDTLYAVASAKFSAEMTEDDSVGQRTTMFIAWRRGDNDAPEKPPGQFLDVDELTGLRSLWEEHGRPKMPEAAAPVLWEVVKRLKGVRPGVSVPLEVADIRLQFAANAYTRKYLEDQIVMPSGDQTSEGQQ